VFAKRIWIRFLKKPTGGDAICGIPEGNKHKFDDQISGSIGKRYGAQGVFDLGQFEGSS
jgi:hypothetical protein